MAQVSEASGAAPLQPEPYVPVEVSWHQTGRVRVPLEPHAGPHPPQSPVRHSTQLGFEHSADVGPHPPHLDNGCHTSPSQQVAGRVMVCGPHPPQVPQSPHEQVNEHVHGSSTG